MSVRMALAKLSAFAAGGALIGGGAVHVAEAPAAQTTYVKHAKVAVCAGGDHNGSAPGCGRVVARRHIARMAHAEPRKVRRIRRVITRTYSQPQEMAMVPVPYMPPLPPQPVSSSGGGQTVVVGGGI